MNQPAAPAPQAYNIVFSPLFKSMRQIARDPRYIFEIYHTCRENFPRVSRHIKLSAAMHLFFIRSRANDK